MAALDWLQSLLGGGQYGDPSTPAMPAQPMPDDALTRLRDMLGQGAASSLYAGGGDVQPGLAAVGRAVVAPALAGGAALEATMTGQPVSAAEMLQAAMMGITPTPTRLPGGVPSATPTAMERLWGDESGALRFGGRPIRAYHGSPHDIPAEPGFPLGRFRDDRIGTGEGAQAYGHGMPYLAEAERVARGYRDALSATKPQQIISPTGDPLLSFQNSGQLYGKRYELADQFFPPDPDNPMDWMRNSLAGAWLDNSLKPPTAEDILHKAFGGSRGMADDRVLAEADRLAALGQDRLQGYTLKQPGHMYEVDIHADPKAFLDWDRPLREQPDVLEKIQAQTSLRTPLYLGEKTGQEAYGGIAQGLRPATLSEIAASGGEGGPVLASRALKEAGVPGIRYLDRGSRGAGEGSSNYVMFDPSLVEILRKYGILPPLAIGGGLLATGSEPPT